MGRVEIIGNAQVFVPVFVRTIRVEVGDLAQQTRTLVTTDNPQFRPILPDDVDENLNVVLARNFGIREAPAPALNITCGSMVCIARVKPPWICRSLRSPSTARHGSCEA